MHRQVFISQRYIALMARAAPMMILIYLLANCRSEQNSIDVAGALSFLETGAPSANPLAANVNCDTLFLARFNRGMMSRGCSYRIADSMFYWYTTLNDSVMVRGRRMRVNAERLRPLADSVQTALSARFRRGVSCLGLDATDTYTGNFHSWLLDNRTIFLRTTMLNAPHSLFPALTLESMAGHNACAMERGGPPAHL